MFDNILKAFFFSIYILTYVRRYISYSTDYFLSTIIIRFIIIYDVYII